jgi:hypothetical protein
VLSKYSEAEIYTATAIPTPLAIAIFFWNIMHVAIHRPRYVKYLVMFK